jgi:transcriptional regulator with XRE-family HTH domain
MSTHQTSRTATVGSRELARREAELRRRIGRQVQELRSEAGVSQRQLARCAGVSAGYLWKIEAGEASASLQVLTAIGACLGADASVRFFPGAGPRLHDRFQAPMVEALLRIRHASWSAQPEVPVPAARGVIDLVLARAADRCTIACECHSELRRLELVLRRAAEKATALGPRFDDGAPTSTLLLLRSTESTRAIAKGYEATLTAAYPARAADAHAALTTANAAWSGAAILWARFERGRAQILDAPPRGVRVGR